MHVLVTGGTGFLGRAIVTKLLARGDSVRILARRPAPDLAAQGVECVTASLTDIPKVQEACAGVDAVFHVAAKTGIWGPRREYLETNLEGTRNILAACRLQRVRRLIYTSTPSVVYGEEPIEGGDESLPYPSRYLTWYAESKAAAEKLILEANGPELQTCSLRPHLIWGPGDTQLIPRLIQRACAGRLFQVGDGSNRIGVSYIENIADAHLAACDRLERGSVVCGQAYFVTEPGSVYCWDFIRELLERLHCPGIRGRISLSTAYWLGAACELLYGLLRLRREPPMTRFLALQLGTSHWFDIGKAQRDLGWHSRISIEEGMHRLTEAFRPLADGRSNSR